jgi:signal transduction histidine kinase/ActR/RegA family two-component response regulator
LQPEKLSLIVKLTDPDQRRNTARELARYVGADDLTIFIFDADIQVFLPAPGFPQTLPDGRKWKSFLDECKKNGRVIALLSYPGFAQPVQVLGMRGPQGNIIALLGGTNQEDEVEEIRLLLPLLAAAFKGEQMVTNAKAKASVALEMAADSKTLAESLDRARRDLGIALIEAKKAEDGLKEADKRKDEFLATLAHELRNPLAPIGNALQLLKLTGNKPEILENVRGIMENQVQQMVRLVDDLMDVSRITQGKIELRKERVMLGDIIKNAVEIAKPLIEENNHTLMVKLPAEVIWLEADFTRIAQVFSNLLNNAAKYTERGGTIEISARMEDQKVHVSMQDNGLGIPPEKLKHIFDLFAQVDSSIERSRGGLGIGLTLVKKLVEMHGGTIQAESMGLGKGSEFIICLPTTNMETTSATSAIDELIPKKSHSYRILVVDDNEASAKTMMWTMEMLGHTSQIAHDGPSGIELSKSFYPDIVLLDIGLPGMNGYEVCQAMRKDPVLKNTVYVAQTGWGQKEHLERSNAAGFDYHLVKPVDINVLKNIISALDDANFKQDSLETI